MALFDESSRVSEKTSLNFLMKMGRGRVGGKGGSVGYEIGTWYMSLGRADCAVISRYRHLIVVSSLVSSIPPTCSQHQC